MYINALLISLYISIAGTRLLFESEYMEVVHENPEIASFTGGISRFNRTAKTLYCTFTTYRNVSDDSYVIFEVFKFLSNQYKITNIRFQKTIKSVLKVDWFGWQNLFLNLSTPPLVWPIKTNVEYKIKDYAPKDFPPGIPTGKYKMDFTFVTTKSISGGIKFSWFCSITEQLKWKGRN